MIQYHLIDKNDPETTIEAVRLDEGEAVAILKFAARMTGRSCAVSPHHDGMILSMGATGDGKPTPIRIPVLWGEMLLIEPGKAETAHTMPMDTFKASQWEVAGEANMGDDDAPAEDAAPLDSAAAEISASEPEPAEAAPAPDSDVVPTEPPPADVADTTPPVNPVANPGPIATG